MNQAEASLPAEPERRRIVAMSMTDSGAADECMHVSVIEHVGEAMRDWDSSTRGDSWVPPSTYEEQGSRDLPPLRLREPRVWRQH